MERLIDTSRSAHAASAWNGITAVSLLPGFWKDRLKQNSTVTLERLWTLLTAAEKGHVWQNLRIAAGLEEGKFKGCPWSDEWLAKWLEAASVVSVTDPDCSHLAARIDECIELLGKAQAADGYLASQTQADKKSRFQDPGDHELYTMGHLITTAVINHRLTGKPGLLDIARKAADYVCETFAGDSVKNKAHFPYNPTIIMGLVELYREVGDKRYLEGAQGFVDRRGSLKPEERQEKTPLWFEGDQLQNHIPLREETEMVGHSVLGTYLYSGAVDVYLETGEKALIEALRRIWWDFVNHKMFIHGGACALFQGLSIRGQYGTESHAIDWVAEAPGPAYFLPHERSYNETCAQIGVFMWAARMILTEPQPDIIYADTMEQLLYGSILSGIGLDGTSWFYSNPLRWSGHPDNPAEPPFRSGENFFTCTRFEPSANGEAICCPSNLLRMVSEFQSYLYTLKSDEIWVHHFAASESELELPGGQKVKLTQKTIYPWDGAIELSVETDTTEEIALCVRIPSWTSEATIEVGGEKLQPQPGEYCRIARKWTGGETLRISLPMRPKLISANPLVEECRNQVAVMRGPMTYCLEGHDLPEGVALRDVYLSRNTFFEPEFRSDLLGGVTVLKANAVVNRATIGPKKLYQEMAWEPEETTLSMIPYFVWANRGPSPMSVWLPLA